MSKESSASHSKRPVLVAGIVGAVIVITLMLGVTYLQAGSNVSEVSISSTYSTLASSSSSSQSESSSGTTSSSSTMSSSTSIYNGPTGILGVSLTDPPIVPPGVTSVYISYSSVQVHVGDAGNQDGWYLVAESGSVDLMSLINVSLTLGSAAVQAGVFNLISFNITNAQVTMNGANITAYVPANRIIIPIVGGIAVSTGNSSGVLVDLSPEVVPYQNGTSVSYVLVPEARSLPIPKAIWNHELEVKGAKLDEIQNQSWVTNATGQVVATGVNVLPNSFSLTLQNQGTSNASFSSIIIGQVVNQPVCYATASSGSPRPSVENVSSYVSVKPQQHYVVGNGTELLLGQVYPLPSTANTNASILVSDPNGVVVESLLVPVELTGAFHASFVAGGLVLPWVGGVYSALVNYNGTEGRANFTWSSSVTSTSTTESHSYSTSNYTETFSNTTTIRENSTTSTVSSAAVKLTAMTNSTSYFDHEGILVYGTVSSAPTSSNFTVNIRVIGPERVWVFNGAVQVASDGTFSVAFPAGNPVNVTTDRPVWANGTYTVYAFRGSLVGYTKFYWSGFGATVVSFTETTSVNTTTSYTTSHTTTSYNSSHNTSWTNTTTQSDPKQFQSSFCSLQNNNEDRSKLPPSISVAYFAIFANGTLYPVNYTSLILYQHSYHVTRDGDKNSSSSASLGKSPLTFTLAPGQSVTFTFNGKVDSLNGILLSYMPRNFAVPSSLFQINPGQEYTVMASGPFDVRVAAIVNATSTG